MAFFCIFSQRVVALLVLSRISACILGANTHPDVEIKSAGWLFGPQPDEDLEPDPPGYNNIRSGLNLLSETERTHPSFTFGGEKPEHAIYKMYYGMRYINLINGCAVQRDEKENFWSSSTTAVTSAYAGGNIGYESSINVGVELPVKIAEISAESEFRTALMLGWSSFNEEVEREASGGKSFSSYVSLKRTLYTLSVDFEEVIWDESFKKAIRNLSEDNVLNFFFEFGTHLYREADMGYVCFQNVYFQSGYEESEYKNFMSEGSTIDFESTGFKYGTNIDTTGGLTSEHTNSFDVHISSFECRGTARVRGCEAHDPSSEGHPVIIGWKVVPVWDIDIPGLTSEKKQIMEEKFEEVMFEYVRCATQHCNGRGACKVKGGLDGNQPISNFCDKGVGCICFGEARGATCNIAPPSDQDASFTSLNYLAVTSLDGSFTKQTEYGFSGVLSQHSDFHEDRNFRFMEVALDLADSEVSNIQILETTQYKGNNELECDEDGMVFKFESWHSNADRKFKVSCHTFTNYKWDKDKACEFTGKNSLDRDHDAKCSEYGSNYLIVGFKSSYSHHYGDRQYEFKCCPFVRHLSPKNLCKLPGDVVLKKTNLPCTFQSWPSPRFKCQIFPVERFDQPHGYGNPAVTLFGQDRCEITLQPVHWAYAGRDFYFESSHSLVDINDCFAEETVLEQC